MKVVCQCQAPGSEQTCVVVRQRDTALYDLYYAFSLQDEISRNKESGKRVETRDRPERTCVAKEKRNVRTLERERDSRLVRTKDPVCVVTWGRGLVLHNGQARLVTSHITHTSPLSPRLCPVSDGPGARPLGSSPLPTLTLAPASSCLRISIQALLVNSILYRIAASRTASVCHFLIFFTSEQRLWNVKYPK